MKAADFAARYPEIHDMVLQRKLSYPIRTKEEFVAQMTSTPEPVIFRGQPFEVNHGANLMPDFFFPVVSAEDLTQKVVELLITRGLAPLPQVV